MTGMSARLYLSSVPLLRPLTQAQIDELAEGVVIQEAKPGRMLYLDGDPGDRVFVVHGGRVRCSRALRDGRVLTLAYREAGDLVGEMCVFDGAPRDEMAEVTAGSLISELPKAKVVALLRSDPALAFRFAAMMGERRRRIERRCELLVMHDVPARLAAVLIELGERHGAPCAEGVRIESRTRQHDLADMIASTRTTVTVTLKNFERRGWVKVVDRRLVIADGEALKRIAEAPRGGMALER
jgi:CRP/FNR family cyclic AMP-dependent transcriptional regulator